MIVLETPQVTTLNLSNGLIVLSGTLVEMENSVPMLGEWRTLGLMLLLMAVGAEILYRHHKQHA